MFHTTFPEHYKRLAATFGSENEVFSYRREGDLNNRLCRSAAYGHVEMVQYFIDQGGFLNDPMASRRLGHCHGQEHLRFLGALRTRGQSLSQPLLRAIKDGPRANETVVALLLARGADPNWSSPEDTPLLAAVARNKTSIIRLLVEGGADVNDGIPPPIVLAVRNENTQTFQYLLDQGATLASPKTGAWAMAFAKLYALDSMVELLVREGVDETAVLQRVPTSDELWSYGYHSYKF